MIDHVLAVLSNPAPQQWLLIVLAGLFVIIDPTALLAPDARPLSVEAQMNDHGIFEAQCPCCRCPFKTGVGK